MWSAFTGCKSAVMSRETEPSGRLWNTSTPQSVMGNSQLPHRSLTTL